MDESLRRDDVGAVLLTGAGRAFVAGADIGELADQTAIEGKRRAERGQRTFRKFERSTKPTLAAVNGFALGGGCELAMACHLRLASDSAKFGQPEARLGITPGYGGTQRLPRLVGKGRALELLLTGEMIDAAEAYRIGLVNRIVPGAELMDAARALLGSILANGPLAVAHCIDAVDRGAAMSLDDALALEASYFGVLSASADKAEGMRAFLDKQPAQFTGR
jgi:enoyl-CoA hydratase